MNKSIYFLSFILIALFSCNSNFKYEIEKSKNGVTILKDSLKIQIDIIDDAIIHVTKILKDSKPSEIPDYVTVLEAQNIAWDLDETLDKITISTAKLIVFVNSDGTIEYETKQHKKLVAETKTNTFIKSDGKDKHTVSQAFIAGDEGLYGLGQFQSGIMNWKNVPLRLQQYNQEIAIPFLVSTKGYGIYWNNYSITDFNSPANEIQFASSDKIQISNNTNSEKGTEKENVIAHVSALTVEKNSRETTFTPSKTGVYSFLAISDTKGRMRGEVKVTIDGDDIINYKTIWVPLRYSGKKYLEAGKEYKVVFQNTGATILGQLFYNEPDYNKTVFSSLAGNAIDYYLVHGENPAQVISEYQRLTGKAPMFPKSAFGFWQCRERYHNQEELLENAREMRERKIPVDNIVQDWFYWPENQKGPEWDRTKYPDPKAMVKELTKMNYRLMVSVWPELKHDRLQKEYNLTMVEGSKKIDVYDTENQKNFYRMLSDSMFQIGVKSIWLDGSEPAGMSDKNIKTAVGPNNEVYNAYSLLLTKMMYEGKRKEFPMERVFNLTRSSYAGQQRYGAASWSGDVQSTWEQFAEQIPAGLNFTMAGVPYWTHDIGGFFRDSKSLNPIFDNQYTNPEYIELLTRWFQFGAFSPIFRIHGYVSETEIWRYGSEFENTARKFIDLRYQLMPYIYSESRKVTTDGNLLMSPMVYHYPKDKNTWGIKDQFFFGASLMVSIVTDYKQREKQVYLPKGVWYNFWTDKKVGGGREYMAKASLNETPIFVKAGSIIPIGPKVQYATERSRKSILLKIYPGKDAEFIFYLDDGESYNYEKGMYSEIVIRYSEKNKTLQIKKGIDNYMMFKSVPVWFEAKMVGQEKIHDAYFVGDQLDIKF